MEVVHTVFFYEGIMDSMQCLGRQNRLFSKIYVVGVGRFSCLDCNIHNLSPSSIHTCINLLIRILLTKISPTSTTTGKPYVSYISMSVFARTHTEIHFSRNTHGNSCISYIIVYLFFPHNERLFQLYLMFQCTNYFFYIFRQRSQLF